MTTTAFPNELIEVLGNERQAEIHAERDRKLEEARKQRQIRRQQVA